MPAALTGPRLSPRSGAARQLVVFLHGYGADGNDLIEIGRQWQPWLPDAAFVAPHAPEACGMSAMALHVALRRPVPIAAIVGYSGMLVLEEGKGPESLGAQVRAKPPILLVHGD